MGAFELEPFDTGTLEMAEAAAELTAAGKLVSIAGGGDTVAALHKAGAAGRFSLCIHSRGRFSRMARRQAASRRRGAAGKVNAMPSPCPRVIG